jgi:mono/diheme cytochrome c family protein
MTTLVFVLVFILLGLGVFFVAMSGGPGGALARVHSQSRTGRRMAGLGFVVALVLLGFAVPIAVITVIKDRTSVENANIGSLTASEQRGRILFGNRCAACHTLAAANAVAEVGPNLDQLKPNRALVLATIKSGITGNGNMPAQIYQGQDAIDVANFVSRVAGASGNG